MARQGPGRRYRTEGVFMRTQSKTWQNVLYICILLAAICLLFQWYSTANRQRIKNQNLNYAMDSASQMSQRIKSEFSNALRRVRNYAYLLGVDQDRTTVTAQLLKGMEENADFDAILFTDTEGLTLASDGKTGDSRDRNYYILGMQGGSGLEVLNSWLNEQTMAVFYAPVECNGEIIGVLMGLYFPEDYLRDMLTATYFGEPADAFLCARDGTVIASSGSGSVYDQPLPDALRDAGSIDAGTAEKVWAAFRDGAEDAGFICAAGSLTDNLCVFHIPNSEYVLVQTFPKSVTQAMVRNANHTGMVLQMILIGLFAVYILVLLVRGRARSKLLEKQNLQFGYVLDGLNTLFSSRYLTADLENNTYSYMGGIRPLNIGQATEGAYDDIIAAHSRDIIGEDEQELFRQILSAPSVAELLSEEDTFNYECHVNRDGTEQWENLIAVCLQRKDGRVVRVLYVRQNITDQVRKQREQTQALQDALMQAQRASKAKTTFLSNMSHDIRTPMNAIIGFTTIAISHIDSREQVKDCLQKVLSSSNHLLSLINDILDMSRIESGKVQIKEQECNISELTHNLVNIIQPQVKAKQLELFIDTFDINNEDVIADSLKLSQVFVNLLTNAVKYTPAGGSVSFRIRQQTTFHRGYGDYVFIVKDNGIGMAPDFVEHIFEPFEREASTTKTGIQGTGLGMSITKNIVEMMGGTITVQSEKGKGSEFRVELSLKLQDVEKNAAQIKELEGLRAIVVDDDCDSCESVTRMLKQIGMRSEWTTSGKEAVYRAKIAHNEGDPYKTYIIDWQMPEISGIETCRRIRASVGEDAPIIILTAYDWTDIESEARLAGVTAFCAKPLFMSDLKSALLAANNLGEKEGDLPARIQPDFAGRRVLLVEDNELNREIAQAILEEAGFEVETAPDGTDAVGMVRRSEEHYYDVILMDVQMPVMDGYEATRTIRSLPRKDVSTLPIIAMTANAMEEDKETALKNGMNAHIAKPLHIELFLKTLSKFLN